MADHAGGIRAQQMGGNRRVTRPDHYDIRFQLVGHLVDHVTYVTKADMGPDPRRIDAEMADHGLQPGLCLVLDMLLEAAHIGGKAMQTKAGRAR